MKYRIVMEPQPEGGYTVYVPALPGCISEGDSRTEAIANIREAIAAYTESIAERNLPTPQIEESEVIV
ncbi:MAG: type II toxin-antitoxin system HicB family antitoxin [Dehalococcoidia bacterium]|nr:type II toxin-antitoxin system HicB family antitoxin [Dehalococcoidia bacterium]